MAAKWLSITPSSSKPNKHESYATGPGQTEDVPVDTNECVTLEHLDPATGLSILCARCLHLFRHELAAVEFPPTTPCAPHRGLRYQEFPHHKSPADLLQAVNRGCHLCYTILSRWRLLPESEKRDITRLGDSCLTWVPEQHLITNKIMFYFGRPSNGLKVFPDGLTMQHRVEDKLDPALEASLYTIANTTASTESSNLALSWIKTCIQTHETCTQYARANTRPDVFPARLVDVSSLGPGHIRLHFPTSLEDARPYLTLSHRWGGETSVVKLTAQTADTLRTGFPISSLPKTFREAIAVTRRLGVPYLWIDSLCIRQDDLDDWAAQGSIMGYIYLNRLCSIAASAAENSHQGLFRTRDANLLRPVVAEIPWLSRGPNPPYLKYYICPHDYWSEDVTNATLYRRGWVAQERVLSTRMLHFGEAQITWECLQRQANESFPSANVFLMGDGLRGGGGGLSKALAYCLASGKGLDGAAHPRDVFIAWEAFVKAYSRCEFTFDTDVLPAIDGIAQVCRAALLKGNGGKITGEYGFGLWKDRFLRQLTWYPRPQAGMRLVRNRPLRAPTWSWASVKGPVDYFIEELEVIPFVEMVPGFETGTLLLRGYIQKCSWKRRVHDRGYGLDCGEVEFVIGDQNINAFGYFDETQALEKCASGQPPEFVSMIIAFAWSEIVESYRGMEGLLLRPCVGIGAYERLGMFRVEARTAGQSVIHQYWRDEINRSKSFGPLEMVYLR